MTLPPIKKIPSGRPPRVKPAGTALDLEFLSAMRSWRQSQDPEQSRALWERMELMGAQTPTPNPFYHERFRPSATYEAVCSGSLEALALMVQIAGPMFKKRVNEMKLSGGNKGGINDEAVLLESCWLGAQALGGSSAPMMRALIEHGAHPDGCARRPGHPVYLAVGMGDVEAARALIEAGADPLRRFEGGESLLHYALRRREPTPEMWRMLVEAGIPPGIKDDEGRAPLDVADPAQGHWVIAAYEQLAIREQTIAIKAPTPSAPAPRL